MKNFLNGMVKSPYELNTTMPLTTSNIISDVLSKPMSGCIMSAIKDMTPYDFTEAEEHMEHIERERQAVTDKALIFLSGRCNSVGGADNCPFFNIKNREDCPVGGFSCDKIKPDDWKHYLLNKKKTSVSNEDATPGDVWDIL